MSDLQAIADRVEIEALRGEFTDAAMMRDYDRLASLFTPDGVLRMPNIPVELVGQEEIRAWGERVPDLVDFLVQNTRRPPGAELRHLPRPLPAHRRRLEVHRARLRGPIRGHHSAGGFAAPEYNHDRRHSTIGVTAPVDYERAQRKAAA
jgi:hypothetical protein